MRCIRGCLLLLAWVVTTSPVRATVMGDMIFAAPRFEVVSKNPEYEDSKGVTSSRPPFLAADAARNWARYLRAYRAVQASPAARRLLAKRPIKLREEGGFIGPSLLGTLAAYGIGPDDLRRQSRGVYTVQVASYRSVAEARRFLRRCVRVKDYEMSCGLRPVPCRVELAWGWEGDLKAPLYVRPVGGWLALRYGLYENEHDARLMAAEWQRRWGVHAYPVRVPMTAGLAYEVLFGELPGVGWPEE